MSSDNLLQKISELAMVNAGKAEELEKEHGPWNKRGKNAIEDLYFLASLSQELSASELVDEEAAIMLCLSLAEHVRRHPDIAATKGRNGALIH